MSAALPTPTAPESSLPPSAAQAAHAAVASAVSSSNAETKPAGESDETKEDGPAVDKTVFADASNFELKHPLYSKVSLRPRAPVGGFEGKLRRGG